MLLVSEVPTKAVLTAVRSCSDVVVLTPPPGFGNALGKALGRRLFEPLAAEPPVGVRVSIRVVHLSLRSEPSTRPTLLIRLRVRLQQEAGCGPAGLALVERAAIHLEAQPVAEPAELLAPLVDQLAGLSAGPAASPLLWLYGVAKLAIHPLRPAAAAAAGSVVASTREDPAAARLRRQ